MTKISYECQNAIYLVEKISFFIIPIYPCVDNENFDRMYIW